MKPKNPDRSTDMSHRLQRMAVAALFSAVSTFGQTVQLTQQAEPVTAPAGEYLTVPDLPRPVWAEEGGTPVARLRLTSPNAAAWSVVFQSLFLDKNAQLLLIGTDAAGRVSAAHGPYEGAGPLNMPGFETRIIAGAELTIEVRSGRHTDAWPFEIESIERLDSAQLAGLKDKGLRLETVYRPDKPQQQTSEVRSAWIDDELVQYRIIDGMAVKEGDIVLGPASDVEGGTREKKTFGRESHELTASSTVWTKGVIPYTIEYSEVGLFPGSHMEGRINSAILHWNEQFPGILVKRTNQSDYVTFRYRDQDYCSAADGRRGGQQFITLGLGCFKGHIMHEIGHSLGLVHEHQRPDRDDYLTVNWPNIEPEFKYAFELPTAGTTRMLGEYDFGSIMHYGLSAFSINGEKTLTLKVQPPEGVSVGQRSRLSEGDIAGIRSRYCNVSKWTITPGSIQAASNGGSYSINVAAPPYCAWTASDSVSWINVPSTSKTGPGSVSFTVLANFGSSRAANIRIQSGGTTKLVLVSQSSDPFNSPN